MTWIAPMVTGAIAASTDPNASALYPIPTSSDLKFWGNAQSPRNTYTSSNVDVIGDNGPDGRDITLGGTGQQVISSNTYNGEQAIEFTAQSESASHLSLGSSPFWTIILVASNTSNNAWLQESGTSAQFRIPQQNIIFHNGTTQYVSFNLPNSRTAMSTYIIRYSSGNELIMWQDGTPVLSTTPTTDTIEWDAVFGDPVNIQGDWLDLLIYSSLLNDGDLNSLLATLKSRYGADIPAQAIIT